MIFTVRIDRLDGSRTYRGRFHDINEAEREAQAWRDAEPFYRVEIADDSDPDSIAFDEWCNNRGDETAYYPPGSPPRGERSRILHDDATKIVWELERGIEIGLDRAEVIERAIRYTFATDPRPVEQRWVSGQYDRIVSNFAPSAVPPVTLYGADLLRQTADLIEADPDSHDQGAWCGTSCCIAGHVVLLAGWEHVGGYGTGMCRWADEDGVEHEDRVEHVSDVAQDLLGLDESETDLLFSSDAQPADPDMEWPDVLRAIAAGAQIHDVVGHYRYPDPREDY